MISNSPILLLEAVRVVSPLVRPVTHLSALGSHPHRFVEKAERENRSTSGTHPVHNVTIPYGPVAQLGARSVRIREVEGSNPFGATK